MPEFHNSIARSGRPGRKSGITGLSGTAGWSASGGQTRCWQLANWTGCLVIGGQQGRAAGSSHQWSGITGTSFVLFQSESNIFFAKNSTKLCWAYFSALKRVLETCRTKFEKLNWPLKRCRSTSATSWSCPSCWVCLATFSSGSTRRGWKMSSGAKRSIGRRAKKSKWRSGKVQMDVIVGGGAPLSVVVVFSSQLGVAGGARQQCLLWPGLGRDPAGAPAASGRRFVAPNVRLCGVAHRTRHCAATGAPPCQVDAGFYALGRGGSGTRLHRAYLAANLLMKYALKLSVFQVMYT